MIPGKMPKKVAWIQAIGEGEPVATGEITPLAKARKAAIRRIPADVYNALPDHAQAELRTTLDGACNMLANREALSVNIVCFRGDEVAVIDWFHVDPSLIPESSQIGLVVVLMSGEMYRTTGFPTPELRVIMQKVFPRRGGNRE